MSEHFSWIELGVAVATALNVFMNLSIRKEILALELRLTKQMYKIVGSAQDD